MGVSHAYREHESLLSPNEMQAYGISQVGSGHQTITLNLAAACYSRRAAKYGHPFAEDLMNECRRVAKKQRDSIYVFSATAIRCGNWLPIRSSSVTTGLWPRHGHFISPLSSDLQLRQRIFHSLPLFTVHSTLAVSTCFNIPSLFILATPIPY